MDALRRVAAEQRRRLIARVLGHWESTVFPRLAHEEREALREQFIDAVNAYHNLVLDLLKVSDDGIMRNEDAVLLLQRIHDGQRQLERALRDG